MCSLFQARAALEKSKQSLEAENVDMANELKQISVARQDADRRRKQLEQQVQELTVRFNETDRGKSEVIEKATKMQVCFRAEITRPISPIVGSGGGGGRYRALECIM